MSYDRVIKNSNLVMATATWYCVGFKSNGISGSWSKTGVMPNGGSILTTTGGSAISEILQGGLLFETPPSYSDGHMPNQQSPIIDVVYVTDIGAIYKILSVIDNNTIIIDDPASTASGINDMTIYGVCSRFNPPTELDFKGGSNLGISCIDGTKINTGIIPPYKTETQEGVLQPALFISNGGFDCNCVIQH